MDESKHKERDMENKKREREKEEKQHSRRDERDEKNPRMIPIRKENNLTREDTELKDEEEQRRLGEGQGDTKAEEESAGVAGVLHEKK